MLDRFPDVAYLRPVWLLGIRWMINILALSPNTSYVAYLVFKMIDAYGRRILPVDLFVGLEGGLGNAKIVCLDPNMEPKLYVRDRNWYRVLRELDDIVVGLQHPSVRSDGWLEIEMGEFFNLGLQVEEVQMSVIDIKAGEMNADEMKGNFILEGIELRPKVDN